MSRQAFQPLHFVMAVLLTLLGPAFIGTLSAKSALGQSTLIEFHRECKTVHESRTAGCVAAMRRYCMAKSHGGAGVSQEVGVDRIGVGCFAPRSVSEIPKSTLEQAHAGCNAMERSQTAECMAAAHRWCTQNARGTAGIIQEVGASTFAVACFDPTSYHEVPLAAFTAKHADCDALSKAQDAECAAAAHRWCHSGQRGNLALVQEVGTGVFGVACFAGWYGDIFLKTVAVAQWQPSLWTTNGTSSTTGVPSTPVTGDLEVVLEYQPLPAVIICGAKGTVTATSSMQTLSSPYSFGGSVRLPNPPYCETHIQFTTLKPGTWEIKIGNFNVCTKKVEATTVRQTLRIRLNGAGTCI